MSDGIVRAGEERDLAALTGIYNAYVRTSHVTFDVVESSVEERRAWFAHYAPSGRHRLLVLDVDGEVRGYATSSTFRAKAAYDTSVETSVYLHPGAVGVGAGGRLYTALLAEMDAVGVHRCFAGIAQPNEASVRLHLRHGFEHVGTFDEAGFKHGAYRDVAWYRRRGPAAAQASLP
ncbi:MAG: N-acetyltransferase family protein [Nocardioidaceae bacterium]|nr:N-acetyltransferase family protein [Nocardioidaceae bacterium]